MELKELKELHKKGLLPESAVIYLSLVALSQTYESYLRGALDLRFICFSEEEYALANKCLRERLGTDFRKIHFQEANLN